MHLLILHGPNLHSLGTREPDLYGTLTLAQLNEQITAHAASLGADCITLQSNHEGQLLDWLENYAGIVDGCVFNPGAYTHTSVALLDGVRAFAKPVVEVHLTEPLAREPYRHLSFVGEACAARFAGEGVASYLKGISWLVEFLTPSA